MRDMSNKSAKAAMSKATDALEYIKNSIASGKTVYVTAGNRTTKVTPKAYAKWEASGKPLFKISSDGALLMASGSSYVRLTLADEMLARVTAMSRPGAKAVFAAPGIVVKEDAQYIYYYPEEDDRATFADDDGKGAYTVKSNRTGKPVSTKTYRSWEEAVRASNAINEKLPPLKKRKAAMSRPGAKATFGSKRTTAGALRKQLKAQGMTDAAELEWHGISANDPDSTPYWLHEDGSMEKIKSSRPGAKAKMGFVGTAGRAGAMAARGMQDGAAAYRAGKPAVLNRLDPKYRNWSDKDLEVYGNFWMRGWTGEQMKDMTIRNPKRGTDLPGSRFSRPGAKARFEVLNANYAKMEVRYMKPDGQTETEIVSGSARAAVSSAIRRIEKMGDGAKVWVKAFVPAHPLGRFPAFENVIWKGEVKGGRAYEHGGDFSRPGAKAEMAKSFMLDGMNVTGVFKAKSPGEWTSYYAKWMDAQTGTQQNGYLVVSIDGTYKLHNTAGRVLKEGKTVSSRPGAKVTAGRAEDLYRKLSSGSITYANAKQWERLVTEALRLPDYTPPGGDMSLHEIAEDLGGDLMALKTHSGPVPNAKAKAEKATDLEREDVKAGLKLMEKADKAVSDKIRTLIAEGKPQDQAVAIALDMKRRGEI